MSILNLSNLRYRSNHNFLPSPFLNLMVILIYLWFFRTSLRMSILVFFISRRKLPSKGILVKRLVSVSWKSSPQAPILVQYPHQSGANSGLKLDPLSPPPSTRSPPNKFHGRLWTSAISVYKV